MGSHCGLMAKQCMRFHCTFQRSSVQCTAVHFRAVVCSAGIERCIGAVQKGGLAGLLSLPTGIIKLNEAPPCGCLHSDDDDDLAGVEVDDADCTDDGVDNTNYDFNIYMCM